MKMKKLNKNFKIGDIVVCTTSTWKGQVFKIEVVLNDNYTYSCSRIGSNDGKYYGFNDNCLELYEVK